MFKSILVAMHGDENKTFLSKLSEIINLAKPYVTVIHVAETSLAHYGYVDQLASAITKAQFINYIHDTAEEKQKEIFSNFGHIAEELEIDFQWKVREGKPSEEIAKEFNSRNYDLLVLGTKPKSPGNTSSKVKEKILNNLAGSLLIIE